MEATAGGTPGGPFPTGGSRGQGRGQRPAGVSPLGPRFHRPLSQLVNNQPQVPGRVAMKGHCGHSGGRRELGLHLPPPGGFPAHPKRHSPGSPHSGKGDRALPSGAPVWWAGRLVPKPTCCGRGWYVHLEAPTAGGEMRKKTQPCC